MPINSSEASSSLFDTSLTVSFQEEAGVDYCHRQSDSRDAEHQHLHPAPAQMATGSSAREGPIVTQPDDQLGNLSARAAPDGAGSLPATCLAAVGAALNGCSVPGPGRLPVCPAAEAEHTATILATLSVLLLALSMVFGVGFNALAVLTLSSCRHLRTLCNRLVLCICVFDMGMSVVYPLLQLLHIVVPFVRQETAGARIMHKFSCVSRRFIVELCFNIKMSFIVTIALLRYMHVCWNTELPTTPSNTLLVVLPGVALSLGLTVITQLQLTHYCSKAYAVTPGGWAIASRPYTFDPDHSMFLDIVRTTIALACLAAIIFSYGSIAVKAVKTRLQLHRALRQQLLARRVPKPGSESSLQGQGSRVAEPKLIPRDRDLLKARTDAVEIPLRLALTRQRELGEGSFTQEDALLADKPPRTQPDSATCPVEGRTTANGKAREGQGPRAEDVGNPVNDDIVNTQSKAGSSAMAVIAEVTHPPVLGANKSVQLHIVTQGITNNVGALGGRGTASDDTMVVSLVRDDQETNINDVKSTSSDEAITSLCQLNDVGNEETLKMVNVSAKNTTHTDQEPDEECDSKDMIESVAYQHPSTNDFANATAARNVRPPHLSPTPSSHHETCGRTTAGKSPPRQAWGVSAEEPGSAAEAPQRRHIVLRPSALLAVPSGSSAATSWRRVSVSRGDRSATSGALPAVAVRVRPPRYDVLSTVALLAHLLLFLATFILPIILVTHRRDQPSCLEMPDQHELRDLLVVLMVFVHTTFVTPMVLLFSQAFREAVSSQVARLAARLRCSD